MVPDGYSAEQSVPLVVALHGFGGDGRSYVQYWTRNGQVDKRGFIMAAPTGSTDSRGRAFWNASAACCNKDQRDVDDSRYLRRLIETIEQRFSIDPTMIHITGYSNGGFMAYRMACDHADKVSSIVSVAGAGVVDEAVCKPSSSVSVLQVHGLEDAVIRYHGGDTKNYDSPERLPYPSALETVAFWGRHNGARPEAVAGPTRDFSDRATGDETRSIRFVGGAAAAELWSMAGEGHVPRLSDAFHAAATDWMLSHRKASD